MAFDRDNTLKQAEKLLRQGRLDQAIAEYVQVVENRPKDWTTRNVLGDLYVRAGQPAQAAEQYAVIAKHFADDGFLPKAGALYKKILKIQPDNEEIQLEWADVAARQGLLADVKAQLRAVADRRRDRGDSAGANEVLVRLGSLDPTDFEARRRAAQLVEEQGDTAGAADRHRKMAADLEEAERLEEALDALREAVRLDPGDSASRARLAAAAVAAGQSDEARRYLSREVAGDDPALLELLAGMMLDADEVREGLDVLRGLLARDPPVPEIRARVVQLALGLAPKHSDGAMACLDLAVEPRLAAGEYEVAASLLMDFASRAPAQIPALLRLIEVCVDGGLETMMHQAQVRLAEAYLAAEMATEASVVAEDLVAREPWESTHVDRFRRALVMQGVTNPDAVIADRLSGHSPFVATDPFAEPGEPDVDQESSPGSTPVPVEAAGSEPAPAGAPSDPAFRVTIGGIDLKAVANGLPDTALEIQEAEPVEAPGPGVPPRGATASPPSLGEVFDDMRRAAGQGPGRGGASDLALAETYVDMGMIDEAIAALQHAARSPRYRFQAAARLASLHKARGEMIPAIEWMERATQAPSPTPEAGHELFYELGITLESLGEAARALAVFLELQAEAGTYRDVAERVDRLARTQAGG